jgi:hypothetical protein
MQLTLDECLIIEIIVFLDIMLYQILLGERLKGHCQLFCFN